MQGQGYQYIGGAIVPMHPDGTLMEDPGAHDPDRPLPGAVTQAPTVVVQSLPVPSVVAALPAPTPVDVGSPGAVIKAAKARIAEIKALLRDKKRLEKELGELERLVAAAKKKPVAVVRNIDHARQAR